MTLQPIAAAPVVADLWWLVYLRGALVGRVETYAQSVSFHLKVPTTRPARFVVVRRDGGASDGFFDRPRIALDVWHEKDNVNGEHWSTELANLLIALAKVAPLSGAGCTNVTHLSGPNSVADPSGQPRRLALIEATHRATVIT